MSALTVFVPQEGCIRIPDVGKSATLYKLAKTQSVVASCELAGELYDYIIILEKVAAGAMAIHEESARLGVHLVTLSEMGRRNSRCVENS